MTVTPHLPIGHAPSATTAEIDGQLVALDIESGTCFGLNRVATRIWHMLEVPRTASEVSAELALIYDIDEGTCEAQTLELLNELVEIGLACPVPQTATSAYA